MYSFNPRGTKLPALERNILKYRAIEMVLILFYVEEMKIFTVRSIQVTDKFRIKYSKQEERLPKGTKKLYKKLWQILVDEGVLTLEEREDIEKIIDYRNDIAHSIQELVFDLNLSSYSRNFVEFKEAKYDYGILERLKLYKEKIYKGLSGKYIFELSMNPVLFEQAERTYQQELKRLNKKIRRLLEQRKEENNKVECEINGLDRAILDQLAPYHPENVKLNGQLTDRGIECCNSLFGMGLSNLAISYLMRLSLKAVNRHKVKWQVKNT